MSEPGTKSPPNRFPKDSHGETKLPEPNAKTVKEDHLSFGRYTQPADIGTAPTSRVYTRDYSKVGREPDDTDLVTAALGNPLGI